MVLLTLQLYSAPPAPPTHLPFHPLPHLYPSLTIIIQPFCSRHTLRRAFNVLMNKTHIYQTSGHPRVLLRFLVQYFQTSVVRVLYLSTVCNGIEYFPTWVQCFEITSTESHHTPQHQHANLNIEQLIPRLTFTRVHISRKAYFFLYWLSKNINTVYGEFMKCYVSWVGEEQSPALVKQYTHYHT